MNPNVSNGTIEQLIIQDIDEIAQSFQVSFTQCVQNVQKPNVLVAGVTGAGKSSLINAVFGSQIVSVGDGVPVTSHFDRIEPPDKPIIVYDSKGLEDGYHEEFIADTKNLIECFRAKPRLQDHMHVIWYVVNAACGRFEPFEVQLIREVFVPTPVVIVLNKVDVASGEQLQHLLHAIKSTTGDVVKGIYLVVANRQNYTQSWCTKCFSSDVTYKRFTNEIFCDDCDNVEVMQTRWNLSSLVEATAHLLPDLAKEAFLFSQVESMQEKDIRARELVLHYAMNISLDVSGKALNEVGEMVGRIFVLWGWSSLGMKVCNALIHEMKEEYKNQELSTRLAMIAADTIMKRKLSRSVIACLGVMVNRPLRLLSEQLLNMVDKQMPLDVRSFDMSPSLSNDFYEQFMNTAFHNGIAAAVDRYWFEK